MQNPFSTKGLTRFPQAHGLYSPDNEHDSCGVGFVAHIKGQASHQIVLDADRILRHMTHRGACGCEENTGDGAGMLTALPDRFLRKVAQNELGITLPETGKYGAGVIFLPKDEAAREEFKGIVNELIATQGQTLLGWRKVPQAPDAADIGPSARDAEPWMEMLFVGATDGLDQDALERQLFVIRKMASHRIRESSHPHALDFYSCTLSTKVIVYKGMLTPAQVMPYFPDLQDEDFESHLAMVHSRFSTNTFPSWDRAQPSRFMAHNGEINTLKGNANWMFARQGAMESNLFGDDLKKLFPIIEKHCSDSGNFDNAMEFLYHSGRKLQEVAMMMIPEAWQNHHDMPEDKRAFYEFHSALQEPWDGPASVSFTDGQFIGASLDRNGLRPSRYYVTHDDKVIMASEVGVLDVEPDNVKIKGRLQPGKMFLVDFAQGRLIPDEELKGDVASRRPYNEWLQRQRVDLGELVGHWDESRKESNGEHAIPRLQGDALLEQMQAFGYTTETLQFMLIPLLNAKKDPIYSMGDDASLACLSDQPRLLYDYFKQLFAQVTNPAIDSIREEVIMSLECYIGPEGNLLDTNEEQAHRLRVPHPILTDEELAAIRSLDGYRGWKTKTIDITWAKADGHKGLPEALERICQEAEQAIADGYSLVVLSDRNCGPDRVPVSSLLACGAVHHHLVRNELRTRIGIVLESGEAREVHHFCLLTGYGADAINPYLAFEAIRDAKDHGNLKESFTEEKIVATYREGVRKGMLKVMGKMGISTLQSYKGAQIFEALGLADEVINKCFRGTPSRIKGVGFEILAEEQLRRHEQGFPSRHESHQLPVLPNQGLVHWRHGGEKHGWNPFTIAEIQQAARAGDKDAYARFAKMVNEGDQRQGTLRGLLRFKKAEPIPIEEVEPVSEILKRFCTGAMSYGSISAESHEALAVAMNRVGGKSNTGEGGEDYERFAPMPNGDSKRSSIKQVASGRFGVTSWYLTNADEHQIKISQGAKPGEGGELPGHKVDKIIAATRHSTPGVGLISPPPHHDIYSIEDLAQLIFDLKNSNPSAGISVKLVSEVGVGTIASGVAKGHADKILISGDGGGTGASPLTSIKHAGLPWELGIAETHQTLVMNDLRSRVKLETDGQIRTGRDVAIACLLGAEEFGLATAPLITLGCIMMRKCHLNTCPVGIATQDPELRKKFSGQPDHVVNYLFMVAEECREIMASLGIRTINEMVGRSDLLEWNSDVDHWKAKHLDLTPVLTPALKPHENVGTHCEISQNHGLEETLDQTLLIPQCREAIDKAEPITLDVDIQNIDRAFATTLSHEVSKKWGPQGMPEDTIRLRCRGSAGQSVAAWAAHGVTVEVIGDANDYCGKGLSGGKLIVYPAEGSSFVPEENIIIGNVALYGATEGEAYFRGMAAERFCVRNSGASAVVEGVGDHGCEYMTGGRVVILGSTGRNFAAGMSGGTAWVYAPDRDAFRMNCNLELVDLESVEDIDLAAELRELIEKHHRYTGSTVAEAILNDWDSELKNFVQVMPRDYKRALEELKAAAAADAAGEESPELAESH
ncbi:Ferredoxin-dependent glutamate synthase 1 [Maioricimonas rarisocia]|uniref:Glutamate synthase [NADH] n=1 Tax=Maioricimonas rarisocia TaxID=2528026 RepID=A0A517ZDL8_9PLAN|nr:glutamate synthase large subunit [Maioricimonas rarisocia]QDU40520.1 Ferredoxin-dependent glutamate synthase 1 [Maioricimonas rarisocia]